MGCVCVCVCVCEREREREREILTGVCFSFLEHLLIRQNTVFLNSAEQMKCYSTKAFIAVRPHKSPPLASGELLFPDEKSPHM